MTYILTSEDRRKLEEARGALTQIDKALRNAWNTLTDVRDKRIARDGEEVRRAGRECYDTLDAHGTISAALSLLAGLPKVQEPHADVGLARWLFPTMGTARASSCGCSGQTYGGVTTEHKCAAHAAMKP